MWPVEQVLYFYKYIFIYKIPMLNIQIYIICNIFYHTFHIYEFWLLNRILVL